SFASLGGDSFSGRLPVLVCRRDFLSCRVYETRAALMQLRDYVFLGTSHGLCPECRRLVEAKIIVRDGRVYFRKRCPEHGAVEDFVCSDVAYFDRHEYSQPARVPRAFGTDAAKGCPYDCGLCPEHEQHTCI